MQAIRKYPRQLTRDFRHFFGVGIIDVGKPNGISWVECWHLINSLGAELDSHYIAAVSGWTHSITSETAALIISHDSFIMANWNGKGAKPKRTKLPWDVENVEKKGIAIPGEEAHEILSGLGWEL